MSNGTTDVPSLGLSTVSDSPTPPSPAEMTSPTPSPRPSPLPAAAPVPKRAVTFTTAEQAVLKAIVDTLIGAVRPTDAKVAELSARYQVDPVQLRAFFAQKGSDMDTHSKVIYKLQAYVRPEEARALKVLLTAMSTSIGTFALTGYMAPFNNLAQDQREVALRNWSTSHFTLLRKIFSGVKSLVGLTYFAAVDEFHRSLVWDVIRYPGPPPNLFEAARQPFFEFQFQDPFKLSPDGVLTYDAVIIGSGCGGGVASAVLAQSGARVLVLEKANYYRRDQYHLTEESAFPMLYESAGLVSTDDSGMSVLAGSTFGGGSQINWSASFRTPDYVRKEWAEDHKLPVFTTKRYDDALDAICDRLGVHTSVVQHNPTNAKIVQGCNKLGYHVDVIPRNAPGEHDCGWCTMGCTRGLKQGMQETFLQDAARAGAHFIVSANVVRVTQKNGRASGVIAEYKLPDGSKRKFEVRAKVVVVSAGALNSPAILLKSGLRNKNIGKHLRLHPVSVVRATFDEEIKPWDGCNMSAVSRQVADRNGTNYGSLIETPIIHPGLFGAAMPWRGAEDYKTSTLAFKNTAFFIILCRDTGSGTLTLDNDGRYMLQYPLNQFDYDSIMEGMITSIKIMAAAGAREIQAGSPELDSFQPTSNDPHDPKLLQYIAAVKNAGLPTHKAPLFSAHQMGTCRLGNDKGLSSVLNPHGETWEVKNLFVADASTFPTPSGVNPMITTEAVSYVIAQNAAQRLRQLRMQPAGSARPVSSRL